MDQDQVLFELDMERMYEDFSFSFDEVNAELQVVSDQLVQGEIDLAYEEMMDEMTRQFIEVYEDFDF